MDSLHSPSPVIVGPNGPCVNIDTDMIIPKQFLKTIARTGFGQEPVR